MEITILAIGLLIFFGHFLTGFFERTKIPDVLILMLAGIALGPVFRVVSPADFGKVGPVFTTLALIIILFEAGIHLNVKSLGAAAGHTLTISLSTFAITVLLIAHLADLVLPIDFPAALLIGTILGGTSAAVVVPLIRVLRLAQGPSTILFLESALTDVLVVVLTLGLIRGLAVRAPGTAVAMDAGSLTAGIAGMFLWAALIGAAGAFVWSAILDKIRQLPNTVFTTVAYVLILFGVTELLGYSGAIAALAFGVAVANFPNIPARVFGKIFSFRLVAFQDYERAFFSEAVFLVKTFFFVFLGLSITFTDWTVISVGAGIAVLAILARTLIIRMLAPKTTSRRDASLMSVLIPKGLASAVLASLPLQFGLANGEIIQGTVYAVIFFSIVLCAALVFVLERGQRSAFVGTWFSGFSDEAPAALPQPVTSSIVTEQSLGLPELPVGLQEPNPIRDLGEPKETDEQDQPIL